MCANSLSIASFVSMQVDLSQDVEGNVFFPEYACDDEDSKGHQDAERVWTSDAGTSYYYKPI